jgi:hypothetical protein
MSKFPVLLGGIAVLCAAPATAQKSPPTLSKHAPGGPAKRTLALPASSSLPPAPLVGGSDSCATPDAIAGTGLFGFDNSLATAGPQGQTEPLCSFFGGTTIDHDVWFAWTAPATGTLIFETCGITGVDTKLAAYAGAGCPTVGAAIACSDDDCTAGLQSRLLFSVSAGNAYVLQLGTYPSAPGGSGQFRLTLVTPPAHDDCSTPQAIAGWDRFAFDNTLAATGTQGQTEAACNNFGSSAINNDLWYTWVAPYTGTFAVVTEGLTHLDTKIAVYDGSGCPTGAAIGCNDDGSVADLQTVAVFAATSGNTYTFQIGLFAFTAVTGTGRFAVLSTLPRPEDDCAAPAPISGQGSFPFDNVFSTEGTHGQTEPLCNLLIGTGVDSDSWYLWTPDASGTATITTCPGTFMDTKLAVYAGAACPAPGTALACDEDGCGPTGWQSEVVFGVACGQTYLIQVGSYPYGGPDGGLGDLVISIAGSACPTPSTPLCTGSAIGTTCVACGNNGADGRGCANSGFAAGAQLANSGIARVSADTLVLTCTDLTGPGMFFQSQGVVSPNGFGDGMLCASIGIQRLGIVFPTGGTASHPPSQGAVPISVAGAPVLAPTATKYYQCWYRDALPFCTAATFNTSNAIALTWSP